ncbi:MAG: bifunctional folylpolyglutamate synthase/dihydrofolate synthase [Chloroflexi bacterium]|nr:bifunctional folylpolyglutamate synthase/dihydrofolate synthase [Chloroflexota bacterium]
MDYSEAMDYILSFTDYERDPGQAAAPIRYNLERVYRLMERMGSPHIILRCIHIAGTKGKGSTAAMIASVLSASGHRTALFTSPHLHDFRERIRVDGQKIGEERLAAIVSRLQPHVDSVHATYPELGRLTTFEITTALAFTHFVEQNAQLAVIEAGLGGRLDATNVVQPLVTVLMPISLDHTQILGDTIQAIAAEKAGIVKHGGIVVSAPQPPEALTVFRQVAEEKGARLFLVGSDWRWREDWNERGEPGDLTVDGMFDKYIGLRLPLLGRHQTANAATAIAAIECLRFHHVVVTPDQVREGIGQVKWPGRLEMVSWMPRVLVDGAHNVDSMGKLRQALEDIFNYRRLILILGASVDKDIDGIVKEITPAAHHVVITRSSHTRSASPEIIARAIESPSNATTIVDDVPSALRVATGLAGPKDLIVATGSLFVVVEVREAFGLTEA